MIEIRKIKWEAVRAVWEENLTNMSLEETSAMSCFKKRKQDPETMRLDEVAHYDLENQKFIPTFWGAFHNDNLVGVNSGHMTLDRLYRSRGLFVFPEYRGQRTAQKLLLKTISQAYFEKAIACWSYPKRESWAPYNSTGFTHRGDTYYFRWETSLAGENSRCIRVFDTSAMKELEASGM